MGDRNPVLEPDERARCPSDKLKGRGQLVLIVAIAAWTFLPNSAVSGAEPALSAAALWPSVLATYVSQALIRSASFAGAWQAIWYDARTIG